MFQSMWKLLPLKKMMTKQSSCSSIRTFAPTLEFQEGLSMMVGLIFANAQLQKVLGITMLDIKWILPTTHKPMVKSRCQVRNLRRSLRRQLLLQERIELQNLIMPYGLIGLPSRPQLVHLPAKFGI